MARQTCSLCGEPSRTKLATVYWRWTWPSGDERGWMQKLDPTCGIAFFTTIKNSQAGADQCLICEEEAKWPNAIYLHGWVFVPGREMQELELLHCEQCFMKTEPRYTQGGTRLKDREDGGRRPPAPNPADDPWAALGLHP